MAFAAEVYVTGSNPGGLGLNVYVASGTIGGGGGGGSGGSVTFVQPSTGSAAPAGFSQISALLLDVRPTRVAFSVYNDSDQTYLLSLGPAASTDDWDLCLFPQQFYESPYPSYTGPVSGIGFGAGSGTIRVKEMLP